MDPNPGRSIPSGTGGAGAGRPVPLHPAHYHLPHCLPLCPAARLEAQNLRECHPLLLALWGGALACVNAWVIRRRQSVALPFAGCAAPGPVSGGGYAAGSLVSGAPPRRRLSAAPDPVQPDSQPRGGSRLTLGLALPVTALLLALCLLIPPRPTQGPRPQRKSCKPPWIGPGTCSPWSWTATAGSGWLCP